MYSSGLISRSQFMYLIRFKDLNCMIGWFIRRVTPKPGTWSSCRMNGKFFISKFEFDDILWC